MQLMGKLRKCGLEGMGWFFSDLLREPNLCVLPSGQGALVAPQTHGGGLVPKISTSKELYALGDCVPNFQPSSIFHTKTLLTLN